MFTAFLPRPLLPAFLKACLVPDFGEGFPDAATVELITTTIVESGGRLDDDDCALRRTLVTSTGCPGPGVTVRPGAGFESVVLRPMCNWRLTEVVAP